MFARALFRTSLRRACQAPPKALIEDMLKGTDAEMQDILSNNRKWVDDMNKRDPEFFTKLGKRQEPRYLYIGCSDARVDPTILMSLKYGELFIHRNVGNVVCGSDMNFLTVLEFAIARLNVPHIVVCGHYDCGAVRGSSMQEDHGVIENWLRNIRDVQRLHRPELEAIEDTEKRHRRLVELNVVEQCLNILKTGCVQRRRVATYKESGGLISLPRVHALVFDPADGVLHKLDVDWREEVKDLLRIYNLYPSASQARAK
eukprot:c46266_g1_i1.p1 GENE.c46266_g1_i1~~c46266_g1_i1.p1  ORF type:complete len:270 (-),score=55.97 c46266_g1_i1:108-881(-)